MPAHQKENRAKLDQAFKNKNHSVIINPELDEWYKLGFKGKDIAHLCCNNGIELMSLKNMGAGYCVGFDICDLAIEEATNRAAISNNDCQFVCTDVFDIKDEYHSKFDVVYITVGALGWLPDIKAFFAKVSALLKPTGSLFIYELHPVIEMLSQDDNLAAHPLQIIEPYFKSEPYEDTSGLDYVGKTAEQTTTQYWFVWKISDIITAVIESGLNIARFIEYSHDISQSHNRNQAAGIELPMSYILVAKR
ncbi:class I SAM-dependent methyltransferase [Shewanella pneumatophori]|uniref:Class I SAM-dependent methyltransferase n=1 Tax=Shewanella pneumatophori TaxID=314092 RepID=A0A9X1ZIH2_9GAMM|nr:class I SAM-dependent methyltransferase [Shewanella pneumatophori]MCL1140125.1 class I SAM-dependent methyltransferase [Shewanella pneumatophori]